MAACSLLVAQIVAYFLRCRCCEIAAIGRFLRCPRKGYQRRCLCIDLRRLQTLQLNCADQ